MDAPPHDPAVSRLSPQGGAAGFGTPPRQLLRFVALLGLLGLLACSGSHIAWWRVPSAVSPLVGIASAIAVRAVSITTLFALPVLVAVLVRPRWFCRYVCPTGLLADGANRLCPWRRPSRRLRLPALGRWALWITLGGACLGYPVLVWMDPIVLLTAAANSLRTIPPDRTAWICATGLAAVLLLSFALPGCWCTRLCPLGALQDLAASTRRNLSASTPVAGGWTAARRTVLATGVGLGSALVARRSPGATTDVLRPPGALPDDRFTGVCVRCGNCSRACPAGIIHPDLGVGGLASLLTPLVRFQSDYCRENCRACGDVCPSGAIVVTEPLRIKPTMGLARVDPEICLLSDDRECTACRNHCPYDAIRYVFSQEDYAMRVQVDPSRCPGCGACQVACPTTPEKAIVVRR